VDSIADTTGFHRWTLLFSEVVNLHPIAIIVAVLLFGGIWGFWGVFFAIPLATLVKAVFNAWPDGSMVGDIPEG
jgi:predicted PurR-regulated permease PerM